MVLSHSSQIDFNKVYAYSRLPYSSEKWIDYNNLNQYEQPSNHFYFEWKKSRWQRNMLSIIVFIQTVKICKTILHILWVDMAMQEKYKEKHGMSNFRLWWGEVCRSFDYFSGKVVSLWAFVTYPLDIFNIWKKIKRTSQKQASRHRKDTWTSYWGGARVLWGSSWK